MEVRGTDIRNGKIKREAKKVLLRKIKLIREY